MPMTVEVVPEVDCAGETATAWESVNVDEPYRWGNEWKANADANSGSVTTEARSLCY